MIYPRKRKYEMLSEQHKQVIPWYKDHLDALQRCIKANGTFFRDLATKIAPDWQVSSDPTYWYVSGWQDKDKVRSVLIQIAREWSDECAEERSACFGRVLDALDLVFADLTPLQRSQCQVLVPGSGLGRLVFEIVLKGFQCQGNEFSYHMLLTSNYFLNKASLVGQATLHPFIHKFANQRSRASQIRGVKVPDLDPLLELIKLQKANPSINVQNLMSITTGSFLDLYGPNGLQKSEFYTVSDRSIELRDGNKDRFDAVVTCFFLDTATNVVEYIAGIHNTLKKDGVWVNFGPLLWHFEDDDGKFKATVDGSTRSIPLKGMELSLEDLVSLVEEMGFTFEKRESGIKTSYGGDPRSLGGWIYECEFWIARKRAGSTDS